MTSAIPPTEFTRIQQTNSSPEIIAASLNAAERTHSSALKPLHGNAKRVYPFWKVCQHCSAIFPCQTKEQATRNNACPTCVTVQRHKPKMHHTKSGVVRGPRPMEDRAGMVKVTCTGCGAEVWKPRAWVKRTQQSFCGPSCNGKERAKELVKHAHKARAAWTEAGKASYLEKMSGPNNPAWKGGVTIFKTHGNYVGVRYVRCPTEFMAMARKDGYVMEHRLFVAQALERPLLRSEVVHHKDHNPTNNDLTNLQLFASNRDHKLFEHHGTPAPIWQL